MSQPTSIQLRLSASRDISPWARAAFETAQYAARRGDLVEARAALLRALETQPDFVDAHYALAQVTSDPTEKRTHLAHALMAMPNHLDALRELMVLDGRLSADDAARTHHFNDVETSTVDAPVKTHTSVLVCPVCGGDLTTDPVNKRVVCRFCGYETLNEAPASTMGDLLAAALLERKAEPVRWKIGKRLLHCNQCGAERTIPATALSDRCPFCNANHVVRQDVLGSFQQPDALVRFLISAETADALVRKRLNQLDQRLAGMLDTNAVRRLELDGVYLPFWAFDVLADVTQVITPRSGNGQSRLQQTERTTFRDGLHDVIVAGVSKPPSSMTQKLGRFALGQAVDYAPKLLARYPAALYDIDFDRASMDARSLASQSLRSKHRQTARTNVDISVNSLIVQISFRLLLLPVWVGIITEVDGDLRQVLVNGQTGKVVLGRAQKRRK